MSRSKDISNVDVLSLLDAYANEHHVAGDAGLKSCWWQLARARHGKRNGAAVDPFHPGDVREDLYPTTVVRTTAVDPPPLLDDDEGEGGNGAPLVPTFELLCVADEIQKMENEAEPKSSSEKDEKSQGLRRRKVGDVTNIETSSTDSPHGWTIINEKQQGHNPLEIFGAIAPKELKTAQKHATEALAAYIRAANVAAKILAATNSKKDHESTT